MIYPGCNEENGDLCDSLVLYGECVHYDVWRFSENNVPPHRWDGKCAADDRRRQSNEDQA